MKRTATPQIGTLRLIGEKLCSLGYSAPWWPDEPHWITVGGAILNVKLVVEGPALKIYVGKVVLKRIKFNPYNPRFNPQDVVDKVVTLKTKIDTLEGEFREAIK